MFRRVLSPALVFALVLLGVPVGVTPAAGISTTIVISQFQVAGATAADEFVELHNVGTTPYDLNGHLLTYRSAAGTADSTTTVNVTWTSTTWVPAGGFYLVAATPGFDGGVADRTFSDGTTGRLAGAGGGIVLRKGAANTGIVVDSVGYGTATNALIETAVVTPAPPSNASYVRKANSCQDTDNNAGDFLLSNPSAPRNSTTPSVHCVGDNAPGIATTTPAAGAGGVARNANISVTFSEPVTVDGSWFSISCAASGSHAATVTGSGAGYTLDPTTDFAAGEVCTVTVYASQVTDLDTNDPPDNMAGDATWSFTTENTDQCGDAATLISQIQGSGPTASMSGVVTVEGVVVGDYQGFGQFGGYYVQEEDADADGDAATSEGIFVFNTSFPVAAGERVRITGSAGEFGGLTQLSNVTRRLTCPAGGSVTPTTITLPVASMSVFERYEGMLVSFTQTLTATETFGLGRFGEVRLSANGRLYTPTAVTAPGAAASAQADLNQRSSFVLDDGVNFQNIDPTVHPIGGLSATNTLRSGYTVGGLTGVFDFRFNSYRLQPVGPVAFAAANPRPATPASVGGNTKVASFNVLNFFNGDGLGGGFPTARGANTAFELQRQKAKVISALSAMNADVVGLMEIENDAGPNSALAELVAGLNAAMGAGTYSYIDTGVIGTDAIKVALIYKPAAVMPSGDHAVLTSTVDPRFIDTRNRPALAQTFIRKHSAGKFTVVVNHLKSKGSACDGDPDLGDGQGNCNGTRTQAAAALADWLATDPTGSGDADVLIMGDLNAYTFEDPITTLEAAGYTNLAREFNGLGAYSYVFDGQAGYLDHALATSTLASQATGLVDWHINADEPIVLDYNVEFKTANQVNTFYDAGPFRSSDHDPVIIGLQLTGDLGSLCEITRAVVTNHGVATSLCQKLKAAAAAAARGDDVAADNLLNAYVNEVNATRGKRVSDADADLLIAIAHTL